MKLSTGYYASPSRSPSANSGKVHVVSDAPICGTKFAADMEYQWCAHRVYLPYITCLKCLKLLVRNRIPVHGDRIASEVIYKVRGLEFTHSKIVAVMGGNK